MYAKQLAECLPHNKPQTEKGKKKKKKENNGKKFHKKPTILNTIFIY